MTNEKLEEKLAGKAPLMTEKEVLGKWVGAMAGYIGAAVACYALEVRPEQAALLALPIVKGAQVTGGIGKYVAKCLYK